MTRIHSSFFRLPRLLRLLGMTALVCMPAAASAQLHESVAVEGRYTPEIIKADPLAQLPAKGDFRLDASPLPWAEKGVVADFAPVITPMTVTGWQASRIPSSHRGYLDFGLGSWLNATLSAGYRIVDSDSRLLGVKLQHTSTSLENRHPEASLCNSKRWAYDETLGLYGAFTLGPGRLAGQIDWHLGCFDYFGFNPVWTPLKNPGEDALKAPTQTLNDLAARFSYAATTGADAVSWQLQAGMRYFGFRAYYSPELQKQDEAGTDLYRLVASKGTRETHFDLSAEASMPLSESSSVGAALKGDALTYAHGPASYGNVEVAPYYRFNASGINIKAGAKIDFSFAAQHYNAVHAAPDVTLDYNAGPAALFLHFTGGTLLDTQAWRYGLDYYADPRLDSSTPIHIPLHASFGADFGPFSGFSARASVAYRVMRHLPTAGWYTRMLNTLSPLPAGTDLPAANADFNGRYNLHGWSVGASLRYSFRSVCSVSAEGSWQPQKGSTGYFNGFDRARLTARLAAEVKPIQKLSIQADYSYRGVRHAYMLGQRIDGADLIPEVLSAHRLPDITALGAKVSYTLSPAFALWLRGDNLLNSHADLMPGVAAQGLAVTAGLGWLF